MRVTSKGQVTIPIEVRTKLGIRPGTEVDFVIKGDYARLVKAKRKPGERTRGEEIVAHLKGRGTGTMTTDQIMRLMRGWGDEDDIDR
ncbi:MAG TPA: AbrB/MazE/SpoVT family DNA-binding domain-containing protein [Pyrinomonadaceae bacterium]|nr:AbrB/MazE/SpoVT family DNA-binding domain-containing protein [Pyrinomonadaceae bacterium]